MSSVLASNVYWLVDKEFLGVLWSHVCKPAAYSFGLRFPYLVFQFGPPFFFSRPCTAHILSLLLVTYTTVLFWIAV